MNKYFVLVGLLYKHTHTHTHTHIYIYAFPSNEKKNYTFPNIYVNINNDMNMVLLA